MKRTAIPLALIFLCAAANTPSFAAQTRPNIVLIVADDLGYGELGSYGGDTSITPNLDRLAAEGVRLTEFYANAPECTPTRAALLSGRYQHRVGGLETAIGIGGAGRYEDAAALAERGELGLPPDRSVLASALRDAGYRTAMMGKWHLGYEPEFRPRSHGFEYSIGPLGGGVDYFHHTEPVGEFLGGMLAGDRDFYRNGEEHRREGYYLTDLITDEAIAWLNQQTDAHPFFLYLPYTAPHTPYQGPDDYRPERTTSEEFNQGTRETYLEMVRSLDEGIGRILERLQEDGLAINTLVIFTSDNGPTGLGRATPFSGNKGSVYEGGLRVPAIVRWPGRLRPGTTSAQTAITMDLTASILRIAGAAPPARGLDGIDIVRHLEEGRPDEPRTLFWRIRRGPHDRQAVRDGDLKYMRISRGGEQVEEHLFDLAADPAEQRNLLATRSADANRLRGLWQAWEEETNAESRPRVLGLSAARP